MQKGGLKPAQESYGSWDPNAIFSGEEGKQLSPKGKPKGYAFELEPTPKEEQASAGSSSGWAPTIPAPNSEGDASIASFIPAAAAVEENDQQQTERAGAVHLMLAPAPTPEPEPAHVQQGSLGKLDQAEPEPEPGPEPAEPEPIFCESNDPQGEACNEDFGVDNLGESLTSTSEPTFVPRLSLNLEDLQRGGGSKRDELLYAMDESSPRDKDVGFLALSASARVTARGSRDSRNDTSERDPLSWRTPRDRDVGYVVLSASARLPEEAPAPAPAPASAPAPAPTNSSSPRAAKDALDESGEVPSLAQERQRRKI
jgi:hypothetical protein